MPHRKHFSGLGCICKSVQKEQNNNDEFHLRETGLRHKSLWHAWERQQLCYWEKLFHSLQYISIDLFLLLKQLKRNAPHLSSQLCALPTGMLSLSKDCGDLWWRSAVLQTQAGMSECYSIALFSRLVFQDIILQYWSELVGLGQMFFSVWKRRAHDNRWWIQAASTIVHATFTVTFKQVASVRG